MVNSHRRPLTSSLQKDQWWPFHLGQIACFALISPSFNEHLHSQNHRMGCPILSHFTQWILNQELKICFIFYGKSFCIWLPMKSFVCHFPNKIQKSLSFVCVCVCVCIYVYVCAQLCPTLCNPLDCGPPGVFCLWDFFFFQARILEWIAIPFFRGSYQPRDQTYISGSSCIANGFSTCWAIREALCIYGMILKCLTTGWYRFWPSNQRLLKSWNG